MFHGSADKVAPAQGSQDFAAALKAAGKPVSLNILPGAAHGFDFARNHSGLSPAGEQAASQSVAWLEARFPRAAEPVISSLAVTAGGSARVPLRCPAAAAATCTGTLLVGTARSAYSIARGRSFIVSVRLGASLARSARSAPVPVEVQSIPSGATKAPILRATLRAGS